MFDRYKFDEVRDFYENHVRTDGDVPFGELSSSHVITLHRLMESKERENGDNN